MSTATATRPLLNDALSEMLGVRVPDLVSTAWIAAKFGINVETVRHSIRIGKLPTIPVTDANGEVVAHHVRPGDALLIWGWRLLLPAVQKKSDQT